MKEEIKIVTRESYKNGVRSIEPIEATAIVCSPNGEQSSVLTKEDVWGHWSEDRSKKLDRGMIVARYNEKCPIFNDVVPYKSVTVVGPKKQYDDIVYWLEYVHGCDCVTMEQELDDLRIAIRSEYQCL